MGQILKKVLRILGSRREVLLSASKKNPYIFKVSVKLMKNIPKKTLNPTMMLCFRTCSQRNKVQKATFFLKSYLSENKIKNISVSDETAAGIWKEKAPQLNFGKALSNLLSLQKKTLHFFGQIYEVLSGVIRRSYSKKSLWYANQKCIHNSKKQGAFQSTEKTRVRFLRESAL